MTMATVKCSAKRIILHAIRWDGSMPPPAPLVVNPRGDHRTQMRVYVDRGGTAELLRQDRYAEVLTGDYIIANDFGMTTILSPDKFSAQYDIIP